MKKITILSILLFYFITSTGCSLNDDFDIPQKHTLKNEVFIKNQLIGKWKYWGRFSKERNKWIYNSNSNSFYEFDENGLFVFKDITTNVVLSGKFEITPATEKTNPYIKLSGIKDGSLFEKKILLINFNNNYMSLFDSPFEERYEKQ